MSGSPPKDCGDDRFLSCGDDNISQNLVYRAAILLKEKYGVKKGVLIKLKKNIPVQAGLGGGSSDAATTLLGLNRFWKVGAPLRELMELGAQLGSDVPFFLLQTPFALGKGRGEVIKRFPMKGIKLWHCLVKPSFGIATKKAYQSLLPHALTPQKANVRMLSRSLRTGDIKALQRLLKNSLEHIHNKRLKTIFKIKEELIQAGALTSLMSGSGSCVFGLYSSQKKAQKAARFMRTQHKNWQVFVASTF